MCTVLHPSGPVYPANYRRAKVLPSFRARVRVRVRVGVIVRVRVSLDLSDSCEAPKNPKHTANRRLEKRGGCFPELTSR